MEEFERITNKYKPDYIEKHFESLEEIHVFSLQFFKDVADIYDGITRLRNLDRNPSGFSIDDAPILGLLVRVSKLLKECVKSYPYGVDRLASFLRYRDFALLRVELRAQ